MIKFNKYNVTETTTKARARVHYSLDNRIDGRKCVTIYAKDHINSLGDMFKAEYKNDSDIMTDYFEKGRVVLFEEHPLYNQVRKIVEEV